MTCRPPVDVTLESDHQEANDGIEKTLTAFDFPVNIKNGRTDFKSVLPFCFLTFHNVFV